FLDLIKADLITPAVVELRRPAAFAETGITHNDVDHLQRPCSLPGAGFAHLPIYGIEDLGLCRAARPALLSPSATPPPAANSRSTPMAAAFRTCIPECTACTHCRRACARCAAPPPLRSPAPRSRSATASAACSPPAARSSCRTRRREGPVNGQTQRSGEQRKRGEIHTHAAQREHYS